MALCDKLKKKLQYRCLVWKCHQEDHFPDATEQAHIETMWWTKDDNWGSMLWYHLGNQMIQDPYMSLFGGYSNTCMFCHLVGLSQQVSFPLIFSKSHSLYP